jgi:hypothetical protein
MRTALLRPLFVLALLLGSGTLALAQQAADCNNCACTLPSMLGQTLTTSTTHGVCNTAVPHILNASSFGRFWGIIGNRYTISLCNNAANTQIYITTNTTIPGIITCDNNGCGVANGPSSVSFVPSASATYRVYVFNGACGTLFPNPTNLEVLITCTTIAPPVNDLPCGAIALNSNTPNCVYGFGDNQAATNSANTVLGVGPPPGCTGALYQGADVWYSTTVPPSGLLGIQTAEPGVCAGAFQLYTATACNGTFTQLAGGCVIGGLTGPTAPPATVFDAFANVPPLAVGTTIYIRYWERNGNENGAHQICAYEAQRPPNDEPCASIVLPLNTSCVPSTYMFENASNLATVTTNPATPNCGTTTYMGDVWFQFTVPNPLPGNWSGISVNTSAGTHNNLAMAWYTLSAGTICGPGTLNQIACNALVTGTQMPSINSASPPVPLVAGQTIYVRLWSETPYVGTYNICAVLNQAPANDDPCGAIPLDLNYGCLMAPFSNASATTTGTTPPGVANAPVPTCGTPVYNDVWFTVTVPPNGIVQFDTQSGGLIDGAMAVYRATSGSCATNNLTLTQVGCAVGGSQQGVLSNQMPYLNITGQPPGATLYVRIWRQGVSNADGSFNLCARRTDNPTGNCFYTLTMQDTGGDGWGGSFVTLCINGVCTNYTVTGANASISVGVTVGQVFTVSYTAAGGNQAQNSYMVTQYGQPVYVSGNNPATGLVYNTTVACNPPPAPSGDCMGAIQICSNITFQPQYQPGAVGGEINPGNAGCMSGENQGVWMTLHFGPNTVPCSPAAFDIVGSGVGGGNNIFDFVMWGPYPSGSTAQTMCPITGAPYRCNWASLSTPTIKGLAFNNSLPAYQFGGGGPMARHMVVNPGDVFMLFVNNWSQSGQQFQLVWKTPPPTFQVLASDCTGGVTTPAPAGSVADNSCEIVPIELLTFDAAAGNNHVDVTWSTASERGSSHFFVERSADGEVFSPVGRVEAMGDAQQLTSYSFVDDAPLKGLSYYRLHQVDLDGNSARTHTVPVMFRGGRVNLDVFPNPADESIWLAFDIDRETPLTWRIMDASGRLVAENVYSTTSGRNLLELPVSRLDQGSYVVELLLKDGSSLGINRFVKQ